MTADELHDKLFELRYWRQIAMDLGAIGVSLREIGNETAEAVQRDPTAVAGAAGLLDLILKHAQAIGELTLGLQDLVSGRLTSIEKKLDKGEI